MYMYMYDIVLLQAIAYVVQLYGAHLGPPFIIAAPLTLFSFHDLAQGPILH